MKPFKKLLKQKETDSVEKRFQDQIRLMPLDMAKPGHKFVIKEYACGANANMRLINMGLRIGDQIEVITNSGHGQIVIAIDYSRYVLGRGIARKIMVEQINPT